MCTTKILITPVKVLDPWQAFEGNTCCRGPQWLNDNKFLETFLLGTAWDMKLQPLDQNIFQKKKKKKEDSLTAFMTVLKKRSQKILPNQLNNLVQYKLSAMINEEEAKKKKKRR